MPAGRIDVRDLAALESFLSSLKAYNDMLYTENARMSASLRDLSHVWADPQYDKLAAALEEMDRGVQAYLRQAEEPERYLERYIEKLGEALDAQF